jgi:hypothetical protein
MMNVIFQQRHHISRWEKELLFYSIVLFANPPILPSCKPERFLSLLHQRPSWIMVRGGKGGSRNEINEWFFSIERSRRRNLTFLYSFGWVSFTLHSNYNVPN